MIFLLLSHNTINQTKLNSIMSYQFHIYGTCDRCKQEKYLADLTVSCCANKLSVASQKVNLPKQVCQSCHNASISHSYSGLRKHVPNCPLNSDN